MTSCELPLIRVSNPGDLIETVPYLMGFHPVESLVLVGFAGAPAGRLQRVTVTMRIDLTDDPAELSLTGLADAFAGSASNAVAILVVTDHLSGDPRSDPRLAALRDAATEDLIGIGLQVLDVLVVTGVAWWSMCCQDAACCPPRGTPRSLGASPAAAAATYAGLVALPDRESLAATLAGDPDAERARLEPMARRVHRRMRDQAERNGRARLHRGETVALLATAKQWQQLPDGLPEVCLTDEQVVRFAVALSEIAVRDAVWLAIDNRSVDAIPLLEQLHRRVPRSRAAPALFLYGWAQWRAGNGTVAMMAAEQALICDPDYSAPELLIAAVQRGLDPRTTPALTDLSGPADVPV